MIENQGLPLKKSIGLKLIKWVFSIYILVTVLLIFSQMYIELSDSEVKLKKELMETVRAFETQLSTVMFSEDEELITEIVKGMKLLPNIDALDLFDEDGIFYRKLREPTFDKNKMISVSSPVYIYEDGEKIYVGKLVLYSSDRTVFTRIEVGLKVDLIAEIIKTVLLLVLFFTSFSKILIKPFRKLAKFADQTDVDNLNVLSLGFEKQDKNEFTVIEKSMNRMIKGLKESREKVVSTLKQVSEMNSKLEESNISLEKKIKARTKEITDYLDNMTNAVFSIDQNLNILSPVSLFSEKLFGQNIEGKKVSEIIFNNIKKGSEEFNKLVLTMNLIFGTSRVQFLALEDFLPKKVTIINPKTSEEKILKLSYAPLCDSNDIILKLMIIAEDVSAIDAFHRSAQMDQLNYFYLKEVITIKDEENLSLKLEKSIECSLVVLEDFISPLSDTYDGKYFKKNIIDLKEKLNGSLDIFSVLKENLKAIIPDDWTEIENHQSKDIDYQLEATEKICNIIESLLRYADAAKLLVPVNYTINLKIKETLNEKIGDIERTFKNLFEYIFLIRDIYQIDEKTYTKAVKIARMYPDFERTMNLIDQRSRFVSFLLKVLIKEDYSEKFVALANSVRLIPHKSKLTEEIIKNNLIDPYRAVIEKAKEED